MAKQAVKAARFNVVVVLRGESGVGKTMVARMIHRLSDRRRKSFVAVNCGAIVDTLLESELFGYEKGAFTGANPGGKAGLIESADGGTLFLDEVGEIPSPLQVKLLRFLESGEVTRVGGTRAKKIDSRIICATTRNLEEMKEAGTFRKDLYYRLHVVPIEIPPLRKRREEIGPLIHFYSERFNREFGLDKQISEKALAVLLAYDYPGNVRELENLLRRLLAMSEGPVVRISDLPSILLEKEDDSTASLGRTVSMIERDLIQETVEKSGSQRKAAKILGVNQSTISRKLKACSK